MSETMRHDPHLYDGFRYGAWCICSCGWKSGTYVSVVGAHLAFGRHLAEQPEAT